MAAPALWKQAAAPPATVVNAEPAPMLLVGQKADQAAESVADKPVDVRPVAVLDT